jgi:transposase-like protein
MARTKGSKDYPETIKRRALELYLEDGWSAAAICEALGLRGPHRLWAWAKAYRQEGEAFFARPRGRPRQVQNEAAYIQQLEMEIDLLKKFHAELRQSSPGRSNTG